MVTAVAAVAAAWLTTMATAAWLTAMAAVTTAWLATVTATIMAAVTAAIMTAITAIVATIATAIVAAITAAFLTIVHLFTKAMLSRYTIHGLHGPGGKCNGTWLGNGLFHLPFFAFAVAFLRTLVVLNTFAFLGFVALTIAFTFP